MMSEKVVAVVSGGMDSTAMAYLLADEGYEVHLVSFDYGQRHAVELEYARRTAEAMGMEHKVVPMRWLGEMLKGSALTDPDVDVPEGHYESETMKATVVPNRNAVMANVAAAYAVAIGARAVALGIHAGDHAVYPDCRPEFRRALEAMLRIGNEGHIRPDFEIVTPFVEMRKEDIAAIGDKLGVDWTNTWSCYKGGEVHCGKCGTCVERREAFELAGVSDPTEYED